MSEGMRGCGQDVGRVFPQGRTAGTKVAGVRCYETSRMVVQKGSQSGMIKLLVWAKRSEALFSQMKVQIVIFQIATDYLRSDMWKWLDQFVHWEI